MTQENRIALTNGIAIFAMFFGSGNLIFPLALGSTAGVHLIPVWLAFLLTGVGLPLLGLFTITLFKGDYWAFFSPLSKVAAFLIITFLLLIIGPLFVGPRTETVTYGSFVELFPHSPISAPLFSAFYFAMVFLILVKRSHFTDIVGKVLGPIKITVFVILIIAAIFVGHETMANNPPLYPQLTHAFTTGYNTMDLLGALFFGGIIYQSILSSCKKKKIDFNQHAVSITLKSCVVGGILLALIYTGFMSAAWLHAAKLQGVQTVSIMSALSLVVFGHSGAWFVCICIGLTCLVTASALTETFTHYLDKIIFKGRISRLYCLIFTLVFMYIMSLLGFDMIIALASPILNYLYPLLIAYCLWQWFYLAKKKRKTRIVAPKQI